ncbi:hypothetical protein RND71_039699 [Anisodus tanguticus]|uniref:Uncharacterized protein n=1 Tax=Anisodus tanguticus TaxID=243964 RepID=A0AAE1UQW2_9SOLA|nr:hypothetical protein RND71_039699 [Anisodus tanguticus]
MARKRVPVMKNATTTVVDTTSDIPIDLPESSTRVVTPDLGIPQNLALIKLMSWLTGTKLDSKFTQAPTKVVTQRPNIPVAMSTPYSVPINETVAAQAVQKLTYSVGSLAAVSEVSRRNNHTPHRGHETKACPVTATHEQRKKAGKEPMVKAPNPGDASKANSKPGVIIKRSSTIPPNTVAS